MIYISTMWTSAGSVEQRRSCRSIAVVSILRYLTSLLLRKSREEERQEEEEQREEKELREEEEQKEEVYFRLRLTLRG